MHMASISESKGAYDVNVRVKWCICRQCRNQRAHMTSMSESKGAYDVNFGVNGGYFFNFGIDGEICRQCCSQWMHSPSRLESMCAVLVDVLWIFLILTRIALN